MLDFVDPRPPVEVHPSEYLRLLGFPRQHVLEGRSSELAEWARAWYAKQGRPWISARTAETTNLADVGFRLDDIEFSCDQLKTQFRAADTHAAVLVAGSAGMECEEHARQCWQDGKPDEYFFLEVYGSAVVEHLITQAAGRICAWADRQNLAVLPHYSPGYPGWPITEQARLLSLVRAGNGQAWPGSLDVLDSGMLVPKKSQLAVFGLSRHLEKVQRRAGLVPCENCSLPKCQYRRAAYMHNSPQIEDVHRLQPANNRDAAGAGSEPLDRNAKYSLNLRALRKWSSERLELSHLPDGSVTATFRYEGTTCSNLGHPLAYDYFIRLAPAQESYVIKELRCVPAAGDVGHTQQCEFIVNADKLTQRIATEAPLLGKPLNGVLIWERPNAPSGCYCDVPRRMHKWGLVFEVLHFALVHHGK